MNILTIGGSDPSSGAGISRDLAVFAELGLYGLAVITALTGQNTSRFLRAEPVSARMLNSQLDSVLDDFEIGAVKIGMVLDSATIRTVCKKLCPLNVPIIVDPVVRSTTGGILLRRSAIGTFRRMLIPMATVMTPNIHELAVISGRQVRGMDDVAAAVEILRARGAHDVMVTGITKGQRIHDMVFAGERTDILSGPRLKGTSHGGGCSYSAALAAMIAAGRGVADSARMARDFAIRSMRHATAPGKGIRVVSGRGAGSEAELLQGAMHELGLVRGMWRLIPECQTNFVFARNNPKSASDVYGLAGRMVRTGTSITVAGSIVAGGSRHVASAVLQMAKKFPAIRSAINIRYDKSTVDIIRRCGMSVASYDRSDEPVRISRREGSSVAWGIRVATADVANPPDAIFHTGAMGKEPMIIIFGCDPGDVTSKISAILAGHTARRRALPSK